MRSRAFGLSRSRYVTDPTCKRAFHCAHPWCIQEDPYKLTVLAKDAQQVCVTAADFFFANQQLSIVTCDEEGILRMYHYSPHGNSHTSFVHAYKANGLSQILNQRTASASFVIPKFMVKSNTGLRSPLLGERRAQIRSYRRLSLFVVSDTRDSVLAIQY